MEPEAEKPGTARAATTASNPPGPPRASPEAWGRAAWPSTYPEPEGAGQAAKEALALDAGERRPLGGDGSQRQSAEATPRGNSLVPDLPPAAGLAHVRRSAAQTTPWGGARLTHPRSREDAPPTGKEL